MNSKYIFLDIDGTIYNSEQGVTKETSDSIKLAREKGHKVFICTGRPKSEVVDEVNEVGFDGYIYTSGAHIEIDNERIFFSQMDKENTLELVKDLDKRGAGYLMQGVKKSFFNSLGKDVLGKVFFNKFANSELKRFNNPEKNIYYSIDDLDVNKDEITKVVVFKEDEVALKKIEEDYSDKFDIIIYPKKRTAVCNGEIMQQNINKALGVQKVLAHFGADQKDTICFGDSRNDFEMIKFCEIGVCMGNGEEIVKEVADEICPAISENGVSKWFEKLNLI